MMKLVRVLWLLVLLPLSVQAHENRPLYVDIIEQADFNYQVRMKIPPTVPRHNQPSLLMPEQCQRLAASQYRCSGPLAGETLQIRYAQYNPSVSAFLRLSLLNGEQYSSLLAATETDWVVPEQESFGGVARHYTWLGIEHILIGLDHLLFVACLLFIAGTFRRVLMTATGFTLAHSITLVLSALEMVRVPVAPVETLIAFSILFLAVEIARGRENTLTFRRPILVSSSFGLLHGFGFAAVLRDIGLPQTELVSGLLFFNLGVEIGQVLFILACVAVMALVKRVLSEQRLYQAEAVAIYAVGILSSYWLFDRGWGVF
ncbi:HupE/UreJ family protein [Pseudomaricurvus alkylphenolicus]|jgi:hydrogenase/urease accessory protein HupE|uniref:HupE/UreJ family protein n=1 Tax=Pseudomaricurvus alkylphenolicus TaxID=1306991 RepID=UPI001422255C|nr:HupE/UreJ family protein [Pseudomaricurvus alkylphenolicus]NIB44924.1 HupE/UreJ family protein [Pseudomaricurvus alkylphenolicus]